MKIDKIKIISTLFILSLIFPVFYQIPIVDAEENNANPKNDLEELSLIEKIFYLYVKLFKPLYQFQTETGAAIPEEIEIGYGETVEVDVGLINLMGDNESWLDVKEENIFPYLNDRYLTFKAEFLESKNIDNKWFINFAPSKVRYAVGNKMRVKAYITLNAPYSSATPIQNTIIRINITDHWINKNYWWPEDDETPLFNKAMWFSMAILMGFGKYSGTLEEQYYNVDILVNVKPFHAVDLDASQLFKLKPNDVATIPIRLENRGNYNDTFGFKITTEHNDIKLVDPGFVSLKPGESTENYLSVAVPPYLRGPGNLEEVKINVFSIEQENQTLATHVVSIETEGFYVSEINLIYILTFTIVVAVSFIIIFLSREKIKISKKSKKTKKDKKEGFLSNLFSEKNKEKTKETKKEEPKKTEKKKKTKEKTVDKKEKLKGFFSSLFEKKEPKKEDEKEKTKNKEKPKKPKKEEQPEIKDKKEEIKKPVKKQKKPSKEQIKKQKELEKIRKKQEKQKRKFGK